MDYIYRNTRPPPMPQPGAPRIQSAAGQRLSTIVEGSSAAPAQTNRISGHGITNLPLARRLHLGDPPEFGQEKRPPSYKSGTEGSIHGPNGEVVRGRDQTSTGWRDNLRRRGGWKRVSLIILAVLLIIGIALGVGLGVGLTRNRRSTGSGTPGSGNPASLPFPLGSWSFTTFLATSATSCTSIADTWSCFPGSTYTQSPNASQYTFNWVITNTSSTNYLISSSGDPFSVNFPNTTLTLMDTNTPNERYTFSATNLVLQANPTNSLSNDNSLTTCFFNSTVLNGALYTKKARTYPSAAMMSSGNGIFQQWRYAINVTITANGGSEVPNCYKSVNNHPSGPQITIATEPATSQCACVYENYM